MDFVATVAYFQVGLTRDSLGQVHAGGSGTAGVELPQCLIRGPTRRVQVIDDVDDMVLHALKSANRLAELHARATVSHRHIKHRLTGAYLVGTQNGDSLQHSGF